MKIEFHSFGVGN